jgi:hypothetical protein
MRSDDLCDFGSGASPGRHLLRREGGRRWYHSVTSQKGQVHVTAITNLGSLDNIAYYQYVMYIQFIAIDPDCSYNVFHEAKCC